MSVSESVRVGVTGSGPARRAGHCHKGHASVHGPHERRSKLEWIPNVHIRHVREGSSRRWNWTLWVELWGRGGDWVGYAPRIECGHATSLFACTPWIPSAMLSANLSAVLPYMSPTSGVSAVLPDMSSTSGVHVQ
eukprot:359175-Chlamydomonas_euryale.AAC.4